jgi:ferredoxin-NADP reductase
VRVTAPTTTLDLAALVRALRWSGELPELEARAESLLAHAAEVSLAPGEVLFGEGDEADALYVLLEGSVQVLAAGSNGRALILAWLEAGRAFGEQAALHAAGGRRLATVRGVEPALLLRLDRAAFEQADDVVAQRLRETGWGYVRDRLARDATFARPGTLEPVREIAEVASPDDPGAILCGCLQVTTGAVDEAIRGGCSMPAELRQVLACATVCGGCAPRLSERLGDSAWLLAEVVGEVHVTESVRAFHVLATTGRMKPWRAGQHVVVGAQIDGHWVDRQYTITAAPGDATLEITVKREQHGLFSNWLFDDRTPGERLRVSAPQGEPAWELGDGPALCFVAGIGVTPAVAACRSLAGIAPSAPVHVDYSGRRAPELPYVQELRGWPGVTVDVRETATDGRLTAAEVRELVALYPGARVLVCGPHAYMRDVGLFLRTAGVPSDRVHFEVFTHAGAPVADADEGGSPHAGSAPAKPDGSTDYEIYLRTEELLSLQVEPEDWAHPDELLFQTVHQSSELWLKLAGTELEQATEHLAGGAIAPALRQLRRAVECMKNVVAALDMLEQMSPWEYHIVRKALGQGSGFDSPGFRRVRDVSPRLGELFHVSRVRICAISVS